MLRLSLADELPCVPEISANKYALNVRFLLPEGVQKTRVYEHDVPFDLTFLQPLSGPRKRHRAARVRQAGALRAANRWRPFCSERCRMVDLGGWASESYKIPENRDDDDSSSESG
jgi:endogenous inhibitor of DNA gyrase (YacG/DUF329 family)